MLETGDDGGGVLMEVEEESKTLSDKSGEGDMLSFRLLNMERGENGRKKDMIDCFPAEDGDTGVFGLEEKEEEGDWVLCSVENGKLLGRVTFGSF